MQTNEPQPYFFNPGMTSEQLEDWLKQQNLYLANFNQFKKEKAALEERLKEIDKSIEWFSAAGFEGVLSFPYTPSPLLENPQTDK